MLAQSVARGRQQLSQPLVAAAGAFAHASVARGLLSPARLAGWERLANPVQGDPARLLSSRLPLSNVQPVLVSCCIAISLLQVEYSMGQCKQAHVEAPLEMVIRDLWQMSGPLLIRMLHTSCFGELLARM